VKGVESVAFLQIGQVGEGQDLFVILLWWIPFIFFLFYGQRINAQMTLLEIGGILNQLNRIRLIAWEETLGVLRRKGCDPKVAEDKLKQIVNSFFIYPETLDPVGVFRKIEHLLDVRDDKLLDNVKEMLPHLDETEVRNIENLIEATTALHQLYKTVRHYYLLSKRTNNVYVIVQLQILLPQIVEYANAYYNALQAFKKGVPVGDGIGALVASRLAYELGNHSLNYEEITKDTILRKVKFEGREIYIIKAKGPGGNVGKPGEAVRTLIEDEKKKISLIVMIDAALKLEGEKTGEVAEGIGAAIGGIGVDKYKIEEVATKHKVPIYAVVIKVSLANAISIMRKEVYTSLKETIDRVKRIILEKSNPGESVIVVGVGNTMGIY